MPNTFQFVDWLTMESLRILVNKLQIAQFMNTDYNKEFTREYAVGDTVRVKLPQRFTIRTGLGYTPQAINRLYSTVVVDQIFGIDFEWDSVEAALKAERGEAAIRREYIEPAMSQIANEIDSRASLWAYQNTNNIVGILGTNPTAIDTFLAARQVLNELACTPGERGMIVPPKVETSLISNLTNFFNPTSEISRQYKEGSMGRASGFDWYASNNLYSHTAGTWAGAVTVTTTSVSGASTLALTCTTGDTFLKGDVISIPNVLAVNPVNRRSTGSPKLFVVTANATGAASAATVSVAPVIYGPGSQYQNVNRLPTAADVVTLWPGTTSPNGKSGTQGLGLNRDAFALVGVKLETPKAVEMASQTRDPETGISIRFVRMFDPQQSKMVNRFDVLLGFGNLYPDNCAVRVACG